MIYRCEELPEAPWGFVPLCCSFKTNKDTVQHNLIYMVNTPTPRPQIATPCMHHFTSFPQPRTSPTI